MPDTDASTSRRYAPLGEGVGFALGNEDLAATVEKDLQKLDSEGKVKELCEKYADQGVSYDLWCLPTA